MKWQGLWCGNARQGKKPTEGSKVWLLKRRLALAVAAALAAHGARAWNDEFATACRVWAYEDYYRYDGHTCVAVASVTGFHEMDWYESVCRDGDGGLLSKGMLFAPAGRSYWSIDGYSHYSGLRRYSAEPAALDGTWAYKDAWGKMHYLPAGLVHKIVHINMDDWLGYKDNDDYNCVANKIIWAGGPELSRCTSDRDGLCQFVDPKASVNYVIVARNVEAPPEAQISKRANTPQGLCAADCQRAHPLCVSFTHSPVGNVCTLQYTELNNTKLPYVQSDGGTHWWERVF